MKEALATLSAEQRAELEEQLHALDEGITVEQLREINAMLDEEINDPSAGPEHRGSSTKHSVSDAEMNITFRPNFAPRNLVDASLGFLVFLVQALLLFIIPGITVYWITGSSLSAIGTVILIYIIFSLFSVWSAKLTDEGIYFKRLLGYPKFLPWNRIISVSVAPRNELIVHGWLWPLIPAREMTASLSSLNHYRISWKEGYCYYPPADIPGFESAVNQKLKPPCA